MTNTQRDLLDTIRQYFSHRGMELEFFPPIDHDDRPSFQFDGGLDSVVVRLSPGRNRTGEAALFGEIVYPDGSSKDLSGSLKNWMKDFSNGWF